MVQGELGQYRLPLSASSSSPSASGLFAAQIVRPLSSASKPFLSEPSITYMLLGASGGWKGELTVNKSAAGSPVSFVASSPPATRRVPTIPTIAAATAVIALPTSPYRPLVLAALTASDSLAVEPA